MAHGIHGAEVGEHQFGRPLHERSGRERQLTAEHFVDFREIGVKGGTMTKNFATIFINLSAIYELFGALKNFIRDGTARLKDYSVVSRLVFFHLGVEPF